MIGADIGGTSTRAVVCDLSGSVLGAASGGPGNPNSVGLDPSAQQIRSTITDAWARTGLADAAMHLVRGVVIGLAGGSRATDSATFLRAAVPAGIAVTPHLVSDLTAAFCSSTPAGEGYVLVAGTGAVAGRVVGDELSERRDGWGWLLGDDGSGFWLGRAAVRETLAALERRQPLGPMSAALLEAAGSAGHAELVQSCYSHPPTWLARFAPLVSRHAGEDPAAARISAEAVRLLCATVLSLEPRPHQPLVLAGSVLTKPGPIADACSTRLRRELPNPVLHAGEGVLGAAWIGLRHQDEGSPTRHARLVNQHLLLP